MICLYLPMFQLYNCINLLNCLGCFGTPKATGTIEEENKYDAAFFGIYRKLCMYSDPMMKLTMERCYEAFIDAGI